MYNQNQGQPSNNQNDFKNPINAALNTFINNNNNNVQINNNQNYNNNFLGNLENIKSPEQNQFKVKKILIIFQIGKNFRKRINRSR